MSVTEAQVLDVLRQIDDPDLGKDIVTLNFVKDLKIQDGIVAFRIELTTPACPIKEEFRSRAEALVQALEGVETVSVHMSAMTAASNPLLAKNAIPGVKNVLAVSSGKGGVGKSTVAVNLAAALQQEGCQVGIMDADVYGPNVPMMLGLSGKPQTEGKQIIPLQTSYGLKVMSLGFMVDEDQAVIWRGPMIHKAIQQFLFEVRWGELDYLVVDMPPGTGDAQLSLSQACHLMGAIIVTTPQNVSVHDVNKSIHMFKTVNVPVIGIIENMSGLSLKGKIEPAIEGSTVTLQAAETPIEVTLGKDGSFEAELALFGTGGGERIAKRHDIPILGKIPLDPSVRVAGDQGTPAVIHNPESLIAQRFRDVAGMLARRVSTLNLS